MSTDAECFVYRMKYDSIYDLFKRGVAVTGADTFEVYGNVVNRIVTNREGPKTLVWTSWPNPQVSTTLQTRRRAQLLVQGRSSFCPWQGRVQVVGHRRESHQV